MTIGKLMRRRLRAPALAMTCLVLAAPAAFAQIAFQDVSGAAGRTGAAVAAGAGTSESVVVADYDRDGFLDLLVTNGNNIRPVYVGGPTQPVRNKGNGNHWLQLDLVGTQSNRAGVGARVFVESGGITQYREQISGYHRWSQNFRRLHLGLWCQHTGGRSRGVARRQRDDACRACRGPPAQAAPGQRVEHRPALGIA